MAATLTPDATTGLGVIFTASDPVFLEGDVGRQIIFQASRGIIVGFGGTDADTISPNNRVRVDIIDDFPNLTAIPAGSWFLRSSPQSDLDPDKKGPVGAKVTLVANKPSFRVGDNGKYIKIYSGVVRITSIVSVTSVIGEILSLMNSTADDPPAAPAGSWTMEVASWSETSGYPRTGDFYQGRLGQASTTEQPTTFWLSASDDFDNYAIGFKADDAIEYTIAARAVNRIEWMADAGPLLMGTSGAEFRIQGQNNGDPLGGDVVPDVKRFSSEGSSAFQPIVIGNKLLFLDRSHKKIYIVAFDLESDGYKADEITALAEHITGDSGIRLQGVAFAQRPDPRIYMVRRDGQMAVLTYFEQEKVVGFTRFRTDGLYEAVAVIPRGPGLSDRVWTIVARSSAGQVKRFVEYFDDDREWTDREWLGLNTDCAFVYDGAPETTFVIPYLGGRKVNVVADGSYIGRFTVNINTGFLVIPEPASVLEVGIDYNSKFVSMRPAIEGSIIEGMPRSWDKVWARLFKTVGGTLNNEDILYPPPTSNRPTVFTGDRPVTGEGFDITGRLSIEQIQPYPMTVLALFGTLTVADHD